MLGRISLDQLQILITVVETGSFSAGARKLNRAQSAVSQSVQGLEDALGLQLFDRSKKLPRLTDAGVAILADARRVVSSVEALQARATSISSEAEPEISIAIEQVFPAEALIASLSEFQRRYPSVSVTLLAEGLGAPEQSLKDDIAKLAIYSPPHDGQPGIECEFFGDVPISVVAAASHPLARIEGPISQAELDEHVQLLLTDRTRKYRGVVIGSRHWRFIDQLNRLDFVVNGLGWCTMPTHLAREHLDNGTLVELDLAIHRGRMLKFPLYAAYKRDHWPGPAARWLLTDLRERFEEWVARTSAGSAETQGIQVRVSLA
ncbi:LysR family transcriptional regulator [Acuticoccus sediminis]|uniref:LysR family transcriptional regulator n=1 Tax=Acuticoccus sediminis TaxID=2184697 RepID=A0A8B2NRC1_9HYPH|nr:LysR family transcriptional regulator [Acuticoccus sediminis]RAI02435.1 LysR family transcriptional regulator [Acuticoccus sediminis]